jgi:hypothetical protein
MLFCQRSAGRNAPWDLFRVDADGLNLYQLTERGTEMERGGYYGRPASCLDLGGEKVWVIWDREFCAVDLETGSIEKILDLGPFLPKDAVVRDFHISATGKRFFIAHSSSLQEGVLRYDIGGKPVAVKLGGYLQGCDPTGPRLLVSKGKVKWGTRMRPDGSRVVDNVGDLTGKWVVDEEGDDIEYFGPEIFAHATLLGGRFIVQGCGKPPEHCIWICEKGMEPRRLAEGPYFWHSGASRDGEWIVADTNWPDQGLQLVHVHSGNFATLCHPGATQDHYEFGHPHPSLSQDGSLCVFRSDRTGVPQIYVAHISEEFKKRVKDGIPEGRRDEA